MTDPVQPRTTKTAKRMTVELLTYANRAKVAEALTAGGYPVSRVTVNRWARGGEMPGIAAQMILELFGHAPETTEAALPKWAERIEERLAEIDRYLLGKSGKAAG